jgi:hypothetical protein
LSVAQPAILRVEMVRICIKVNEDVRKKSGKHASEPVYFPLAACVLAGTPLFAICFSPVSSGYFAATSV